MEQLIDVVVCYLAVRLKYRMNCLHFYRQAFASGCNACFARSVFKSRAAGRFLACHALDLGCFRVSVGLMACENFAIGGFDSGQSANSVRVWQTRESLLSVQPVQTERIALVSQIISLKLAPHSTLTTYVSDLTTVRKTL